MLHLPARLPEQTTARPATYASASPVSRRAEGNLIRLALGTCQHNPPCPAADAIDHGAARVIATHSEQGWSLLCNGVVAFDDTGELLPDGTPIEPHRGPARHVTRTERERSRPVRVRV